MWSRFSSAISGNTSKQPRDVSHSYSNSTDSEAQVLASVLEQHPNLSVFHPQHSNTSVDDLESPSDAYDQQQSGSNPPGSLSRSGRRGLLKRMSRNPNEGGSVRDSIPTLKLPSLGKKVKSPLHLVINDTDSTASRGPESALPESAVTDGGRSSLDSIPTPATAFGGSVRSILRDRNTPGKNASVRFFSREAPKFLSPDNSTALSEPETPPMMERFESLASGLPTPEAQSPEVSGSRHRVRPSLQGIFSSDRSSSPLPQQQPLMSTPAPEPTRSMGSSSVVPSGNLLSNAPSSDDTNIFDVSHSKLPTIPSGSFTPLDDSAVEMFDDEPESHVKFTSASPILGRQESTVFHSAENQRPSMTEHDRVQSFSFGANVFQSITSTKREVVSAPVPSRGSDNSNLVTASDDAADLGMGRPSSRNRSMSETIFTPYRAITGSTLGKTPEAEINDIATSSLVVHSTPSAERPIVPDPFSAHANTYYTPGAGIPPTPPRSSISSHQQHSRKTSKEENELMSLKTQLTLQQELCAQYEIDLGAKNELVGVLNVRLDAMEKEGEKRKQLIRSWKKKVMEMERLCKHLEGEVERSREESLDRSVMDEASSEALRQLHRRINELERNKDMGVEEAMEEARRQGERVVDMEREVESLRMELKKREEGERALKDGIRTAQLGLAEMGQDALGGLDGDELKAVMRRSMLMSEEEKERHRLAMEGWETEREALVRAMEELRAERRAMAEDLDSTREALLAKDEEMHIMKLELEAQWQNTEKTGEIVTELTSEKATLQNELVAAEQKMERMEIEWNEKETRREQLEQELQATLAAHEENVKQYEQLEQELRAEQQHADEVGRALQDREDRIIALQHELKFANDSVARLEQHIKQRDAEVEEIAHKVVAREDEIYELQDQLANIRRSQSHELDSRLRTIDELTKQEQEARAQLEEAIKKKAELQVQASTFGERVKGLEGEVEKLRKQVTTLHAESADKEMKIVQIKKDNNRIAEDNSQLNIALDSKQQELELIKRKLMVKGTAGATPAPNRIAPNRRESSIFNTPGTVSRPSSRLSNGSSSAKELSSSAAPSSYRASSKAPETPDTTLKASTLGKSVRTNTAASVTRPASAIGQSARMSVAGSLGPPPKRSSVVGTPTPPSSGRISSATASRLGTKAATTATTRRASSTVPTEKTPPSRTARTNTTAARSVTSPVMTETETETESEREKENEEPTVKRRVLVPA